MRNFLENGETQTFYYAIKKRPTVYQRIAQCTLYHAMQAVSRCYTPIGSCTKHVFIVMMFQTCRTFPPMTSDWSLAS